MAKPGDVLTTLLHNYGIREKEGCSCHRVSTKMNALGKKGCLEQFSVVVDWVYNSVQEWRRIKREQSDTSHTTWQERLIEMVQPPRFVIEELVQHCITESTD